MEQIEYTRKLEENNNSIRKLIQQYTFQLHKLIEQCLDFTEPLMRQPPIHQKRIRQKQESVQNMFKLQMSALALEGCEYNETLVKISQKLIQYQLKKEQSKQMLNILKKYEEQILPLRTQSVQKQNQLYIVTKNLYESYQDSYQNCVLSPERLEGLNKNYDKKLKLKNEIKDYTKQYIQYVKIKESLNDDNKKKIVQNQEYIMQQVQTENQQQSNNQCDKEIKVCKIYKNYRINQNDENITAKRIPFCDKQNNIQVYKQNLRKSNNYWSNQFQQSTSVSFKTSIKKRQEQDENMNIIYIKDHNINKIPNFAQMSKFDYHLFSLYYKKIEKQQQRYEKLVQQYKNYQEVYYVITDENQSLKIKFKQTSQQFCQNQRKYLNRSKRIDLMENEFDRIQQKLKKLKMGVKPLKSHNEQQMTLQQPQQIQNMVKTNQNEQNNQKKAKFDQRMHTQNKNRKIQILQQQDEFIVMNNFKGSKYLSDRVQKLDQLYQQQEAQHIF